MSQARKPTRPAPPLPGAADSTRQANAGITKLQRLNSLPLEAFSALAELQIQAGSQAFAENLAQFSVEGRAPNARAALEQWTSLIQSKQERIVQLWHHSFRILVSARERAAEVALESTRDPLSTGPTAVPTAAKPAVERRVSAIIIAFPDRRIPARSMAKRIPGVSGVGRRLKAARR